LGTDICQSFIPSSGAPSAVLMEMLTGGVDPLKNFAMSASVPVSVTFCCGATVTEMRDERNTSPLAPDAMVHPLASGLAVMP